MTQPDLKTLIEKIEKLKKLGVVDLSTEEDLSLAVMNLISLEEHFFFTAEKTKKEKYFDWLNQVREIRKEMMNKLLPRDQHEGETWCITKHLLAASMRLIEVGTKLKADGKNKEAQDMFNRAYELYAFFWGLRLKLIDTAGLREAAAEEKPWTLQDILSRLEDCCDE